MAEKETGWATGGRCGDCGHNEGTDDDGQCRFMFVASDPSQVVDTSPTNQCPHYCPRSVGERIARKYLPFHDYDKPLSKMGQQLAADIDSVSPSDAEQLSELRKACKVALPYVREVLAYTRSKPRIRCATRTIEQLRKAIGGTNEKTVNRRNVSMERESRVQRMDTNGEPDADNRHSTSNDVGSSEEDGGIP